MLQKVTADKHPICSSPAFTWEIVIIDDGSKDNTAGLVQVRTRELERGHVSCHARAAGEVCERAGHG